MITYFRPKITMQDWLKVHPYKQISFADRFYLKITNQLFDVLRHIMGGCQLEEKTMSLCSIVVTAYFEDVVSEIGIWKSFTQKHKELYGKYLPFYDLDEDEYQTEDINMEDIRFLLWYTIQKTNDKATIINPDNELLLLLADEFYDILDEITEDIPVNNYMSEIMYNDHLYEDFFQFRNFVQWYLFHCYLIMPSTVNLLESEMETVQKDSDFYKKNKNLIEYSVESVIPFLSPCGPLALKAAQWISLLLKDAPEYADIFSNVEIFNENSAFLVKKIDKKYIYAINVKGDKFAILRDSVNESIDMEHDFNDAFITSSIVKYRGEWHINGYMVSIGKEDFEKAKQEWENVCFSDKLIYERFVKCNRRPIAYFATIEEYRQFCIDKLKFPKDIAFLDERLENYENIVISVSRDDSGMYLHDDVALFINDKHNPCYDKQLAEQSSIVFIADRNYAPAYLLSYLLKNNLLPDMQLKSAISKKRGKQLVSENLDFLIRCLRREVIDL